MKEFDESQLSPPHIVCAAILYKPSEGLDEPTVIAGARHFDAVMRRPERLFRGHQSLIGAPKVKVSDWEQGFIDQHGRFYDRREAMQIVLKNGQPFDAKRNGGNGEELYSEGLY